MSVPESVSEMTRMLAAHAAYNRVAPEHMREPMLKFRSSRRKMHRHLERYDRLLTLGQEILAAYDEKRNIGRETFEKLRKELTENVTDNDDCPKDDR